MLLRKLLPVLAGMLLVPSVAEAHYLWVKIDRQAGGDGAANNFFEESAAAGDGHYLDPFLVSKSTWIRTVEDITPKRIPLQDARAGKEKRWVVSPLPAAAPRSIDSYWLFGVYQYGRKHVLLHYYARYLDVTSHEDLHELADADLMALDMVPHDVGNKLEIKVVWNAKPVPDRVVHVRGPKGFKQNFKTDDRGKIQFEIVAEGEHSFRTSVEEQKSGEHDGERYDSVRHNATLIMKLPLAE